MMQSKYLCHAYSDSGVVSCEVCVCCVSDHYDSEEEVSYRCDSSLILLLEVFRIKWPGREISRLTSYDRVCLNASCVLENHYGGCLINVRPVEEFPA